MEVAPEGWDGTYLFFVMTRAIAWFAYRATGDRPLEFSDVWTPPGRRSMPSIVRRRH